MRRLILIILGCVPPGLGNIRDMNVSCGSREEGLRCLRFERSGGLSIGSARRK